MSPSPKFTHPTLHVIDSVKHRVLWQELFTSAAWYGEHQIIAKGEDRYRIVRQQTGVHHYHVWVERLAEFA